MEDEYEYVRVLKMISTILAGVFIVIIILWGMSAVGMYYNVWSESKAGEAELARAESNRQIKTLEARAAQESARYLAEAEVIRAQGVARANEIISDSLKDNEGYLRYLWITGLNSEKSQVIYVPTEAGLPILEAGRLNER